jgi:hypothetical protein
MFRIVQDSAQYKAMLQCSSSLIFSLNLGKVCVCDYIYIYIHTIIYIYIYTIIITHEFRLLCIPLTLNSILEERGPTNNAGYNYLPEEIGILCVRLF